MLSDKVLLEKITYTAGLATTPSDIDNMLDDVRLITSRSSDNTPLTAEDRAVLESVQKELEVYLVEREPLRQYTAESLQLQIEGHLQGTRRRRSLAQLFATIGLTIAAGLAIGYAPILSDNPGSHLQFTVATMFSILHLGALSLLLTALPAFKTQLRRAFITLCGGYAVLTATFLLQPILELQGITSGTLALMLNSCLYFAASVFIYAGVRLYVRLLGVQGWASRLTGHLCAAVVAILISLLLRHTADGVPSWAFDAASSMHGVVLYASVAATVLLVKAISKVSGPYKPSMRALALALGVTMAACLYIYIIRLTFGLAARGPLSLTAAASVLIMGITLTRAGYLFNKVSRY